MNTAVVYLCFAPYGPEMVERFVASYKRHPAGADHKLVVAYHGFTSAKSTAGAASLFDGIEKEPLRSDPNLWDLGVYREAVDEVDADRFLFLNSHSELLADDWLAKLSEGGSELPMPTFPTIVGATASHEAGAGTPPFPNPHLRSNAFMLARGGIKMFDWPRVTNRHDAWLLECGPNSLTRQAQNLSYGYVAVVGANGKGYMSDEWRDSKTYRSGAQENLLIADNRTRDYAGSDNATKSLLAGFAWDGLKVTA